MKTKHWTITTSGDRPVKEVAADLKKKGLSGTEVLEEIDCIMGSADDKTADALRSVNGVTDVSETPGADVGPPDAEIS